MIIETMYNIGDVHWGISNNRIISRRVVRIDIEVYNLGDAPPGTRTKYTLDDLTSVTQENFIDTKEALIDTL